MNIVDKEYSTLLDDLEPIPIFISIFFSKIEKFYYRGENVSM